jgi:enamine deaminase RidA (YjgF/YER057c/UK114 family)
MTMYRLYTPPGASNWRVPVSHRQGVRQERYLFIGGQSDLDQAGNVRNPGDLARQCEAALTQVERCVAQLGGRCEDILKLNVFYSGASLDAEAALLRQIGKRIRCPVPPVISLVALERLPYPDMRITIDAFAVDNNDGLAPRQAADVPGHWAWPADAPFSHGIRCGELLLVSAQTARDARGAILYPGDIVSQAQLTIDNIGRVLAGMGADLDDVVKLNTWFVGQGTDEDWRRAARVRSEAFRFPGPGATGVPVARPYPDGGLIRQECWAMRGLDGRRLPRSLSWPVGHWDWPIPVSFQQGVKVGNWIFLGGQYACDVAGKAVNPGQRAEQTDMTMDYIESVLAGFGATMDDLVKTTCFYKSDGTPEALHTNLELRSRRFKAPAGASTSVSLETMGLEGLMLEIEGIALVAGSGNQ